MISRAGWWTALAPLRGNDYIEAMTTSPCTGICEIGVAGWCRGCGRTLDEIARWSESDERERTRIAAAARARQGEDA